MSGWQHAASPICGWRRDDRKILFIFALYGPAAGSFSYVASLSYDDQFTEGVAAAANFPALMAMFFIEWNVANPNGFFILNQFTIIPGSILVWSFIGFLLYLLVRMFRMGP